ncbi:MULTISPECIES: Wzz/FepE/Etk N-terminal domain-containing protein [unclassified Pseudoalteromonas]|uniref:Wzz/FepE/Etk N-terminal domain-containing protein n=1 Tax=unclassified Pseudoalteromonas TaxID=194690 RepID=UPI000413F0E4|nr:MULTISPECIES: Wzz/FepE/Etk N-terminal domain-containing protein [unclassified Pseudoalteromonas]MBH0048889.1 LPS O-antigen length regulator [Pseudoalteromonas sp. SWYJZ19]MDN3384145.1 Wzz/FepE/Etk N-terminal domain-containing protein [Pseudoalteromonas sp. APC 3358]
MNNQDYIEVDFRTLISILWKGRILIVGITALFSVIAVLFSLSLPNIYRSEALISVVEQGQDSPLSGLSSTFGGLASIAGINLQAGSGSKRDIAIETLKSRTFISDFININELKPLLIGVEGWNAEKNELIYDSEVYDIENNIWVREVSYPKTKTPSDLEAYRYLIKENLSISEDEDTGFIRVSIKHYSPYIAKRILDSLINSINNKLRMIDIEEANKSVVFLQSKLKETKNVDIRKIMFDMIEGQVQNQMLAEVRDEYVFKTIDPAIVDEVKFSPKRAILSIMGAILGFFIAVFSLLVFFIYKRQK